MAQLQQFLFELSFGQTGKIRKYMLKRYNVYCGSMKDRESRIIATTGRVLRGRMAERIYGMIQESTNLKVWKVQPKRYHKGYCPTICKSRRVAKLEQERLERITGFEQ